MTTTATFLLRERKSKTPLEMLEKAEKTESNDSPRRKKKRAFFQLFSVGVLRFFFSSSSFSSSFYSHRYGQYNSIRFALLFFPLAATREKEENEELEQLETKRKLTA